MESFLVVDRRSKRCLHGGGPGKSLPTVSAPTLESIRKASASPHVFDLVLRIPLIPGINDSDENLRRIAAFASGLKRIRAVEFLAYHRLGRETYRALGRAYPLEAVPIPDPDFMRAKALFFLSHVEGVAVKINGISVKA